MTSKRIPTLCMVSDSIGPYNAIGRVAADGVRAALAGGYRVTVVADRLDEKLRPQVEWIKLYGPPRGIALQWLTGRLWIKRALLGRQFDVVHAHQPQAADLADVYQCHFLTRVAFERDCLFDRSGWRAAVDRLQKTIVLHAEDYYYRRWNSRTHMLFDSELTRQQFIRLYGRPLIERALPYTFPELTFPTDEQKRAAKLRWLGHVPTEPVVGYLGGLQERKGVDRLINAARRESGWLWLMGGQYTETFYPAELGGRIIPVGLVSDLTSFYAACDAFIVPSLFEPLGLVAFEAAAHGVPVIATDEVGALPHLLHCGAAMKWNPAAPLLPLLEQAATGRATFRQGAEQMHAAYGSDAYTAALLQTYASVLDSRQDASRPTAAVT